MTGEAQIPQPDPQAQFSILVANAEEDLTRLSAAQRACAISFGALEEFLESLVSSLQTRWLKLEAQNPEFIETPQGQALDTLITRWETINLPDLPEPFDGTELQALKALILPPSEAK